MDIKVVRMEEERKGPRFDSSGGIKWLWVVVVVVAVVKIHS
jgi:hypothetical protein